MFVNRRTIRIEWGDCDPAGIVYFPRYLIHFDNCTVHLFEAATGLRKIQLAGESGIAGIPMVDLKTRFIIPTEYGQDVDVESQVTEFRRSSFEVRHMLFHGAKLAVECLETRVWTVHDPKSPGGLKSAPIPKSIKDCFAQETPRKA